MGVCSRSGTCAYFQPTLKAVSARKRCSTDSELSPDCNRFFAKAQSPAAKKIPPLEPLKPHRSNRPSPHESVTGQDCENCLRKRKLPPQTKAYRAILADYESASAGSPCGRKRSLARCVARARRPIDRQGDR